MCNARKGDTGQVTGLLSPILEYIRLKKIARHIGNGKDVLDVGCGRGRILSFIPRPASYVGADTLEKVIVANRGNFPQWRFLRVEIENDELPRDVGPFDIVILGAVVEHFRTPGRTVTKLRKYLKPDGVIILTTPSSRGGWLLKTGADTGLLSREAEEEHGVLLDKADIERLAADGGMAVIYYEKFLLGFNQLAILGEAGDNKAVL